MVCNSTDGAILNLEEEEVYDINEEAAEDLEVSEWRISCVACHDPHSNDLRVEDTTLLCSNCHNTEGYLPDGQTPMVRHSQWEMVSASEYVDGTHPSVIGCVDCHMAGISSPEMVVTGHGFDFDVETLSDANSTNGCYACHLDTLDSIVQDIQVPVNERLEEANELQMVAATSLESLNGTAAYDAQMMNYTNGLYYLNYVNNDGSHGVHNPLMTMSSLDLAENSFNMVISSVPEQETGDNNVSGFTAFMLVIAIGIFFIVKRD